MSSRPSAIGGEDSAPVYPSRDSDPRWYELAQSSLNYFLKRRTDKAVQRSVAAPLLNWLERMRLIERNSRGWWTITEIGKVVVEPKFAPGEDLLDHCEPLPFKEEIEFHVTKDKVAISGGFWKKRQPGAQ